MTQSVSEVPARARQETEAAGGDPHELWWAEASIWTDPMVRALGNGVKGGKWFSLVDKVFRPQTLLVAWEKVARNKGGAGVDGQSIERFGAGADKYLGELHGSLKDGHYLPLPVKRVDIPKGRGQTRPLGIPAVKDRIVQTALKMVIEPVFETAFRRGSFGFRPGLGCKDALREVDRLVKSGFTHVVDADLKSYFDTIPHERLLALVAQKISDGRVLGLVEGYLKQDVMQGMAQWTPVRGTPQGAVISPLLANISDFALANISDFALANISDFALANIYLDPLDLLMEQSGYQMVRYADDFVVMCQTAQAAASALAMITQWVATNGLTLHPDKTQICDCAQRGGGFEFLGYRFEAGRRFVRKKSLQAFKDKLRAHTSRSRGDSMAKIIAGLNPLLRGWFGYFQQAIPSYFVALDKFTRRRLRAILRKQDKNPGMGRSLEDHKQWPNAFFAAMGLFTLTEAYQAIKHPR